MYRVLTQRHTQNDVAPPNDDATPWPRNPPSGPTTRTYALYVKVNSILSTLDLDTTLDGVLPHSYMSCVTRYELRQGSGEEEALTWCKGKGRAREKKGRRKKRKREGKRRREAGASRQPWPAPTGRSLQAGHGRSLHSLPGRYHLQERHTREKARPVPLGGGSTRGTAQG